MKKLRNKWLMWTSKVLSSAIALLGLSSCWFQPCMYGVPDPKWNPDSTGMDSIKSDTSKLDSATRPPREPIFRAMYSVSPAPYQRLDVIDNGGVDIEIKKD